MINKNETNATITGWFITGLFYSIIGQTKLADYYIDSATCLFINVIDKANKVHYE